MVQIDFSPSHKRYLSTTSFFSSEIDLIDIKSLFGIVRESRELYKQITSINNFKKVVILEAENIKLDDFIEHHIFQSETNSLKVEKLIERVLRKINKLDD